MKRSVHSYLSNTVTTIALTCSPLSIVLAQSEEPALSTSARLLQMVPMFVMVFFVFYLFVIGPQKKEFQAREALLSSLKRGDEVVAGGILGKFHAMEQDFILLEVANGVRIKVEKNSIRQLPQAKDSAKASNAK